MTAYEVQFSLPVNNPEKNVLVTKRKEMWIFEVPINHPDAHNMGFMDLLAAAELSGLLGVSTPLKNKIAVLKGSSSKEGHGNAKNAPDLRHGVGDS